MCAGPLSHAQPTQDFGVAFCLPLVLHSSTTGLCSQLYNRVGNPLLSQDTPRLFITEICRALDSRGPVSSPSPDKPRSCISVVSASSLNLTFRTYRLVFSFDFHMHFAFWFHTRVFRISNSCYIDRPEFTPQYDWSDLLPPVPVISDSIEGKR